MKDRRLYQQRAFSLLGGVTSRARALIPGRRSGRDDEVLETSLYQVAADFGVAVDVVRRSVDNFQRAGQATKMEAAARLQLVSDGLVRALGGRDQLQAWARSAIPALNDARPLDVLVDGRVKTLERVEKVLRSGVFS